MALRKEERVTLLGMKCELGFFQFCVDRNIVVVTTKTFPRNFPLESTLPSLL
jgi:hypothetical protein